MISMKIDLVLKLYYWFMLTFAEVLVGRRKYINNIPRPITF